MWVGADSQACGERSRIETDGGAHARYERRAIKRAGQQEVEEALQFAVSVIFAASSCDGFGPQQHSTHLVENETQNNPMQ